MSDDRKIGADEKFCSTCGAIIRKEAVICPKCGVQQKSLDDGSGVSSKWLTVLLLHIFFGIAGVSSFYVGNKKRGIVMLVLLAGSIVLFFISIGFVALAANFIIWVIDLIKIITGKFTNAKGEFITQDEKK